MVTERAGGASRQVQGHRASHPFTPPFVNVPSLVLEVVLLSATLVAFPTTAAAQDSTTVPLAPLVGTELRAKTADLDVRGQLLLAYRDSILLQTVRKDSSRQVMIPLSCLHALARRDGKLDRHHSTWKGAGIGLLTGLTVGTALWALSGQQSSEFGHVFHGGSAVGSMALFGAGGAAVGGIIGSSRGLDRWTPVPLPPVSRTTSAAPACP